MSAAFHELVALGAEDADFSFASFLWTPPTPPFFRWTPPTPPFFARTYSRFRVYSVPEPPIEVTKEERVQREAEFMVRVMGASEMRRIFPRNVWCRIAVHMVSDEESDELFVRAWNGFDRDENAAQLYTCSYAKAEPTLDPAMIPCADTALVVWSPAV